VTAVRGLLPLGAPVRLTTPFFNIYGLLTLVGGAIYSAYLFWRKRVLPNRVIGNILIAAGALLIGTASTLTRLGYGQFLYLGELPLGDPDVHRLPLRGPASADEAPRGVFVPGMTGPRWADGLQKAQPSCFNTTLNR